MKNEQFIEKVLKFFATHDIVDMIHWSNEIEFYIICSDLFFWGTADAEDLTPENFDLLERSVLDCKEIDPVCGAIYGCELFCCRARNLRPQGCCYPESKKLWPLFDSAGPERATDFLNPYKPGEREEKIKRAKEKQYKGYFRYLNDAYFIPAKLIKEADEIFNKVPVNYDENPQAHEALKKFAAYKIKDNTPHWNYN